MAGVDVTVVQGRNVSFEMWYRTACDPCAVEPCSVSGVDEYGRRVSLDAKARNADNLRHDTRATLNIATTASMVLGGLSDVMESLKIYPPRISSEVA